MANQDENVRTEVLSFDHVPAGAVGKHPNLAGLIDASKLKQPESVTPTPNQKATVGLPSQYAPYTFKDIVLKPFTGLQMSRFYRAKTDGSLRSLAAAVSSCLENVDSTILTPQDFRYLLYYIRLTSLSTRTYTYKARCHNTLHLEKVVKGLLPESTLTTIEALKKSDLREDILAPIKCKTPVLDSLRIVPGHMRVSDIIAFDEEYEVEDDAATWLANRAFHIESVEGASMLDTFADGPKQGQSKLNLKQRMHLIELLSPEALQELDDWIEQVNNYGVYESITTTCGECGQKIVTEVTISAQDFCPG